MFNYRFETYNRDNFPFIFLLLNDQRKVNDKSFLTSVSNRERKEKLNSLRKPTFERRCMCPLQSDQNIYIYRLKFFINRLIKKFEYCGY